MKNYTNKTAAEKLFLSPIFLVGWTSGFVKTTFDLVTKEQKLTPSVRRSLYGVLPKSQLDTPLTHALAESAYAPLYSAGLTSTALSIAWAPVALITDAIQVDDEGNRFPALRAGYAYGDVLANKVL